MPKLEIRHYGNSRLFVVIEVGEVFRVETLAAAGVLMKVAMGTNLVATGDTMGVQHILAVELATGTLRRIDSDAQCVPLSAKVQIDEAGR